MKGEADKYLEQTKKRIELLNEVPSEASLLHQWHGAHGIPWHAMM